MPNPPGDPLARLRHHQRRSLDAHLRLVVAAHSNHWRGVLQAAGLLSRRGMQSLDDLRTVPPSSLDQLDPGAVLLRPTAQSLTRSGRWRMRWAALAARLSGGAARSVNTRVVEPAFKPVLFHLQRGFPVGSSAEDLDRLADAGLRWLELAGLRGRDVIVSLLPPAGDLAGTQLALGARRAGVAVLELGPDVDPAEVEPLDPSVVVGSPERLWDLGTLSGVRTVLAVGEPLHDLVREGLSHRFGGADVVAAWAPPGVRSLWVECRHGQAAHVDALREHVEVVGADGRPVGTGTAGRVLWTGIGWAGSAFVRLDTGVQAIADDRPCRACGRHTPRLWPVIADPTEAVAERLDGDRRVADWYVERWVSGGRLNVRATVALAGRGASSTGLNGDVPAGVEVITASRRAVAARRREVGDASIIELVDAP